METQVQIFGNPQFGEIRTTKTNEGEPLFCLADICKILDLGNPSQVKTRLKEAGVISNEVGVQTGFKSNGTPAIQIQSLNFITEPNLYRCIFQSRKIEAEQFQDWVTSEVLPTIRKTGGYMITKQEDTPETIMARAVLIAQDTITRMNNQLKAKERQIEVQEATIQHQLPKVNFYDNLMLSGDHHTITTIGAQFNISAVELNKLLIIAGVIRKTGREYSLTAKYQGKDFIWPKTINYEDRKGEKHSIIELRWKERGREHIINLIRRAVSAGVLIEKKGRYFINKEWKQSKAA